MTRLLALAGVLGISFAERLSVLQWTGAAMVMAGVATISEQRRN